MEARNQYSSQDEYSGWLDPLQPRVDAESAPKMLAFEHIWSELVSGRCRIIEASTSEDRCGLLLSASLGPGCVPVPLPPREQQIFLRVLTEGSQKAVALDIGLTFSSVAGILKRCLAYVGLSCVPSKVPLPLVIAAHAFGGRASGSMAELDSPSLGTARFASIARPDIHLEPLLSRSEYLVAQLLIEGKTHKEIADLRESSKRTIANQLGAVYARLHVSGRGELLSYLARLTLGRTRPHSLALAEGRSLENESGSGSRADVFRPGCRVETPPLLRLVSETPASLVGETARTGKLTIARSGSALIIDPCPAPRHLV